VLTALKSCAKGCGFGGPDSTRPVEKSILSSWRAETLGYTEDSGHVGSIAVAKDAGDLHGPRER
jgi:hypothetical protein